MRKIFLTIAAVFALHGYSQSLEIIPLGVYGGSDESNLSAYLIGVEQSNAYLSLDAGTIRSGINKAIALNTFTEDAQHIQRNYIKGYFISHGHLDHLAGLIINSPEDSPKPIYGFSPVIEVLTKNYFTNAAWANFADQGEAPIIGKYNYTALDQMQEFPIANTTMTAKAYTLSHVNPQTSSALLINNNNKQYVLYFGDTGADRIEKTNHLDIIWKDIAPLIIEDKLKNILIEVSFPNEQPENALYGHLTPKLLQEELNNLATYTTKEKLKGINIIVTHLKPSQNSIEIIKNQLYKDNPLDVNYIFPIQGEKISL
ncbi:MBL fold metallo-hydrolase [Myroides sp. LJL115]